MAKQRTLDVADRPVTTARGRAPRAGRPRDEAAGLAILSVTRRLVAAHGYQAVTTQMIAEASRTAKQTLYRRWPSKAELVLDAFLAHAEAEVDKPGPAAGPPHRQLAAFLRRTFEALAETAPAMRGLMATAQTDAKFRAVFRARFIEPRRRALSALLRRALGERRPDADIEAAVLAVYGGVWYRLLLAEPLDASYADRLAALVVKGLGARAPRRQPRSKRVPRASSERSLHGTAREPRRR